MNFYFAPFPVGPTGSVSQFSETGAYSLSGVDATFVAGKSVIGESGTYAVTGQALDFNVSDRLFAVHGEYTVSGSQVLIRLIRVPPPPLPQPGEPGPLFENQWVPVQNVLDSCFTVDEG